MNYTEAFNQILQEKRISKSELGRKSNVSRQSVTHILNGDLGISFPKFLKFANALDYDVYLVPAGSRKPNNSVKIEQ